MCDGGWREVKKTLSVQQGYIFNIQLKYCIAVFPGLYPYTIYMLGTDYTDYTDNRVFFYDRNR